MAIASIEADLEAVAAHEGWQAIAPSNAQTFQRNGLVQKLYASLVAERATVANRMLARVERIHPCPYGGSDDEQGNPGSNHHHSVGMAVATGKPEIYFRQ